MIDDGSTDLSLDVIKGFGDKIRWESGPNRGGGAARNRGLELSRGTWIQFLDADDVLTPDAVKLKLEADPLPNTVICTGIQLLDSSASYRKSAFSDHYDLQTILDSFGSPQTSAPLHRRENLEKIGGFSEDLPCCQEYDLHLRMVVLLGLNFQIVPHIGSFIRIVDTGVSHRTSRQFAKTMAEVLLRAKDEILNIPGFDQTFRSALSQTMALNARQLLHEGNREEAIKLLETAQNLHSSWADKAYPLPLYRVLIRLVGIEAFERLRRCFRTG